jgi:hypothetical protein
VIEGLRVHPHYQDARRDGILRFGPTCEECMQRNHVTVRQQLACGFEPRIEGAEPWHPLYWLRHGLELTTCAGYTTQLPEVVEVVEAYPHWEAGTLTDYLDGERAPAGFLRALVMRKAGLNEHMDAKREERT